MANIYDRLIEIGIIFLIIFAPIYYGSVTLGTTTVIELTILFMLLIWGIGMAVRGDFVFRRTPLDLVILLFCAYSVISTLFFSKYAYASYMGLSLVFCISALYFIVVNHIRSRTQLTRLFMVILLVGFVHAFSHLMQNATGLLRASTGVMFNVGNHFAGYMVIIIPLAVAMTFVIKDIGKRILLIFASVVMAAAMAFSLIAGAMLAFLLSLVFIALLFTRSESTRKQALILASVVLCVLLIISWFGYTPVLKELLTVTNLKTGSPAGRLSLWKSSLAMFADDPVTGTGLNTFDHIYPQYRLPDMYGRAVYAHSDWLQLLTEMGIVGFAIALLGSVFFFLLVLRRSPVTGFGTDWIKGIVVGGLSSVGAGLIHALVEFNFHIPAIAVLFTIIIALTVVAAFGRLKNSRATTAYSDNIGRGDTPGFVLPQWKMHIPVPVRICGFTCLFLIIAFSAVSMIRPCIADSYYRNGIEAQDNLWWDEAAGKYQSAIGFDSDNSDYSHALGNVYAKRVKLTKGAELHEKWYKLALAAYHRALELCPTNGDHHLLLGNLHETVGNIENAETAYVKAISLDPNNAFYHKIYGSFCFRQGNIQKGIAEYKMSLDIYPNDLYNALRECYTISNETGELDSKSRSFLAIAKEICPQSPGAYKTLGRFFEGRGWYDAAYSEYRQAVVLAPEDINLWRRLSGLLTREGKLDEAIDLWQRFLISYPHAVWAYTQLALIYIKQNRLDDAILQYLAAANIDTGSLSYIMKVADLYMQQGKVQEALEIWETVIKQNPHEALAHYRLGAYYEDQGDWISALDFFQRAISADPKNISYRLRLAQSYFKRDLFYEAIQEWKQALELQPENVSVNLQLARVYQRINRQDKAAEYYRQVLELQPSNVEAQKAILVMEDSV